MKIVRLVAASLIWLPAYLAMALLWLLGHPIVLYLGARRLYGWTPAPLAPGHHVLAWLPRWAWLWSNPEDHVDGPRVTPPTSPSTRRWWELAQHWPFWRRAWSWSAWRNTVANERMLYRPTPPGKTFAITTEVLGPITIARSEFSAVVSQGVEWVGNSPHPHEQWKLDRSPRWLWHWSRHGLRSGLWILRAHRNGTYSQLRLGWKIIPAPARDAERYAGLGLQFHRRRLGAD